MSLPASRPLSSQSDTVHPSADTRLNSWKEIAAYFDRDIRTVQLWEKSEALPIHRHEHNSRSSVYAFPSELDAWLHNRRQDRPLNLPAAAAPPLPHPRRQTSRLVLFASAAPLLVAALAALAWHLPHLRELAVLPPNQTLAVLPFEDLSAQDNHNLWVDAFTDDLITGLGTTPNLQVISRHSVLPFRSTHASIASIARQLHASLILEGAIAHQDGKARITARLIDPAHDRLVWAGSYTRPFSDALALQDEVATDITAAVSQRLTGRSAPPTLAERDSSDLSDPSVRIAYLTGLYYLSLRDESNLHKAIDSFQQAIARDPRYAPAYAGLADGYNLLTVWGSLSSREAFPKARAAAQTALSLDPVSAQAYTALAFETYRYEWNFPLAEAYFRKAIQLSPSYATAHQWYGEFLGDMRRFDQSIAELRKSRDLDPLSAIAGSDLAVGYCYAGRAPEAITELHRILALYPGFVPGHNYLATAYMDLDDFANAQKEAGIYTRLTADPTSQQVLRIHIDARAGRLPQARAELHTLLRARHSPTNFQQAQLYFAVGQPDQAYAALDRALREHSWWLITLMVDPSLAPVRNQPRLHHVMQRVGLPLPAQPFPQPEMNHSLPQHQPAMQESQEMLVSNSPPSDP